MKTISTYSQWLFEMWDSTPDVKLLKKIPEGGESDEDTTYEIDIDGNPYQVVILVRRPEEDENNVYLELHFNAKDSSGGKYTDALTGRNNMQKVLGGVWWAIQDWARTRAKKGNLVSFLSVAKSENPGDDRRSKIYADFLMRKASQYGIKVLGSKDITSVYKDLMGMFSHRDSGSVVFKYEIEPLPIQKLAGVQSSPGR